MIGFRFWDLGYDKNKNPILKSASAPSEWQTNVVGEPLRYLADIDIKNQCYFDREAEMWVSWHSEEDDDIFTVPEVGYFAFHSLAHAMNEAEKYGLPCVIGAVDGFGKVAIHEYGFRSEFAQVKGMLNFIPCELHSMNDGNIIMCEEGLNYAFCTECLRKGALKENKCKPVVQFAHDKFMKDISNRYEVDLMSYKKLNYLRFENGYREVHRAS